MSEKEHKGNEHDFREFLERNHRSVAAWPEWKRSFSIYGEPRSEAAQVAGAKQGGGVQSRATGKAT